jgi:hypothetical protein
MLLARERISDIRNLLSHKVNAGGASITSLDRQLLAIATETSRILSSDPRPRTQLPGVLFAEPVGNDQESYPISQFAVMGSMGPDIPGFSALLNPGQSWVFDTIHKGTPDHDRELVNAQSCDFIVEFYAQAKRRITAEFPVAAADAATRAAEQTARDAALDKMRAFVLGHLCHVATDVVSHPYVHDHQWARAPHDLHKFHAEAEAEMEALVARTLLRRESTRSGQAWDAWWPSSEQVPAHFFSAYEEALEQVYQARSRRRTGYGPFEERLADLAPPSLSSDFLKDGYHFYRHGVMSIGYGYGFWSWWGWLAILFAPALVLPLVTAALPRGKQIFLNDKEKRTERAWMEFVTTPLAFGTPASIAFGALVGTLSTRGVEGRYWLGMVGLILAAVLAIVMFATLGVEELHPGFTWPVLFGLPAGLGLLQTLLAVIAAGRGERGGRMGIALVFALPLFLLAAFFVFFGIFPGLVAPDEDAHGPFVSEGFWIAFGLWAALMLFLWIYLPFVLRDVRIPEHPKGGIVERRFVRLFDDTTLHEDAHLADRNAPAQVYPSGRRPLIKLWWEGAGDLYVRSDRYQLVFSPSAEGDDPQFVPAPIGPMTLSELISFLGQTVKQPGGNAAGLLKGEILYPGDPDYELPSGAVFSDHGDGEDDVSDHDAKAAEFKQLGTSAEGTDYRLYHAPKAAQAVRYGIRGPVPPERNLGGAPIDHDPADEGYPFVHDPAQSQASDALMSIAADFSAILCLGATTHMSSLQDSRTQRVEKIYQVFRNWNLDRRRVNEWRAIVAGGAINEKGSDRAGYDDRMLARQAPADKAAWRAPLLGTATPPTAAAQAAFDEGEATIRELGWVKVLREWMEVSRTAGQDTLGADAMLPGNPPNRALSRAMAYLFDLADPTASP